MILVCNSPCWYKIQNCLIQMWGPAERSINYLWVDQYKQDKLLMSAVSGAYLLYDWNNALLRFKLHFPASSVQTSFTWSHPPVGMGIRTVWTWAASELWVWNHPAFSHVKCDFLFFFQTQAIKRDSRHSRLIRSPLLCLCTWVFVLKCAFQ